MRLIELEPEFVLWHDLLRSYPWIKPVGGEFGDKHIGTTLTHGPDITLAEAQGLLFNCPKCNPTHRIQVGFHDRDLLPHHASQSREGGPSRWHASGTGLADLTLTPSIDSGCWHGFITNGEVA